MTSKLYSDEDLDELRSMQKRVTNPGARWVPKPGHRQRNFKVDGQGDEAVRFEVYQRQNESDEEDFSCGIAYIPPGGRRLTLGRYNGPSPFTATSPTVRAFIAPPRAPSRQEGSQRLRPTRPTASQALTAPSGAWSRTSGSRGSLLLRPISRG